MKKLLPILVVVMFVVACGTGFFVYGAYKDYRGESSGVVSDSVVEVSDDNYNDVDSYYKEVKIYSERLIDFLESTVLEIQKGNVTNENRQKLLDDTNSFLLYSQTFNPIPITNEDEIFNDNLMDLIYDSEKVAEYTLQYIFKKENVYQAFHRDSFDNVQIHLDTISRLEKQYYK